MELAVKWEVKIKGKVKSIQLFDAKGNKIKGKDAYWKGDFDCYNNELTSLEGSPNSVSGNFYCYNNKLTSLKGSPNEINGDFYCHDNELTSLKGSPSSVGRGFYCYDNELTSLKGSPNEINGNFVCYDNEPYLRKYGFILSKMKIKNTSAFKEITYTEVFNRRVEWKLL